MLLLLIIWLAINCRSIVIVLFSLTEIDWKQYSDGITMLLFQGDLNYAMDHGVVKLGDKVLQLSRQNFHVHVSPTESPFVLFD